MLHEPNLTTIQLLENTFDLKVHAFCPFITLMINLGFLLFLFDVVYLEICIISKEKNLYLSAVYQFLCIRCPYQD